MEGHNEQHTPGMSDGKLSVVLENGDGTSSVALKKSFLNDHLRKVLSSGPLTPEQLAEIWDEAPTRRAWWLDLHSSADIHAGTTISDIQAAVGRTAGSKTATDNGSSGQPAAAPVFVEYEPSTAVCFGSLPTSDALMMPVCACSQPVASLRPFDWQCAKCKGVIPSPYLLTDEQRRAEVVSIAVSTSVPPPHKHGLGIADHAFDCNCSVCWTHNCGAFAKAEAM